MIAEPRKPGASFWAVLTLVLAPILWILGFGPAVWLTAQGCIESTVVERVYGPILAASLDSPKPVTHLIEWWGSLGLRRGQVVCFDIGSTRWGVTFWGPDEKYATRMGFELPSK